MKLNYWPLCLIFYTEDLPAGYGAYAGFLNVKIRPKYEHDKGLHEHEYVHEWQGIFIPPHPWLYKKYRWYRQWAEVMAFRVQMRFPDRNGHYLTLDDAAWLLSGTRYRLGITPGRARELLKG